MDRKVFNTPQVLRWNKTVQGQRGHAIPDDVVRALDPDGVHITTLPALYNEARDFSTVRTSILLKLEGRDEPRVIFVDIPVRVFNDAETLDHFTYVLKQLYREGEGPQPIEFCTVEGCLNPVAGSRKYPDLCDVHIFELREPTDPDIWIDAEGNEY